MFDLKLSVKGLYDSNPLKYRNACALRVSLALNYSGVVIPNIPGQTYRGADIKYYFLSSAKLYNFMKKTFGRGSIVLKKSHGGVNGSAFESQLIGNKGTYIMQASYSKYFGALGHATIFDGNDAIGGHTYYPYAEEIILWKLN